MKPTAFLRAFVACAVFCATSAAPAAQIDELLNQMTLEEKLLQLLAYRPNGVPRLGIPNLQAGETLHGVVSDSCTSFPQSIALGATFDPELVGRIATVIAKEARAVGIHQCYAPMLGVARDPRWGRVEETYGEDPLLVTRMAVAYIEGVQGTGGGRFGKDRIIATPKHFAADGEPWAGANGEGFETSDRVLREVHFPPFEAAVKTARTGSIMPGHHSIHGVPCHANTWLLGTVLREEWGFDGFITSDMGDIPKLGTGGGYGGYLFVPGDRESATASLNAGVDMELVGNHYMKDIPAAVDQGNVTLATINRSAARILRAKQQLLGFGPPSADTRPASSESDSEKTIRSYQGKDDIWAKLIANGEFTTAESGRKPDWQTIVNHPAHDALALEAAEKAIVLLKNTDHLLPLDPSRVKRVTVVGPLAKNRNLGGYSTGKPKFYVDLVQALQTFQNGALDISYAPGCPDLPDQKWGSKPPAPESPDARRARLKTLLADATAAATTADVVIAMVGHTRDQLGENLDRDTLELPGDQQALVEAMHATGKPVIVIQTGGNIFSTGWIHGTIPAVIQAFYLGQSTGTALANVLFGKVNPGGKMPLTTPRNVGQSPWYYNHPPLTGPINYYGSSHGPIHPFGHGLSYTTFEFTDLKITGSITRDQAATVTAIIRNTGQREGDEVAQLYIRQDFTSLVRPVKELKGFQRVTLKPGEARQVSFPIGFEQIKFWKDAAWTAESGTIQVMLGASSQDIRLKGSIPCQMER